MFDRSIWFAALLTLSIPQTTSHTQEETTTKNQLMVVPPPIESIISLGIYDNKGKLVRVLKKGADINSFKSGLNGLFVGWDHNDAQGKPMPPGKYYARGVAVGAVKIESVAFHLNDWVDRAGQTRVSRIYSIALLNDLHLAIIADTPTRQLLLFDPTITIAKPISLNFNAQSIKSISSILVVFDKGQIAFIDSATGHQVGQKTSSDIRDVDGLGDRNIILTGTQISDQIGTAPIQEVKLPEENLSHCALLNSTIVMASKTAKVWKLDQQNFVPIDIGETDELLDMGAGTGDTVWLLVKTGNTTLIKHVDLSGKSLCEIELPADLQSASRLTASREQDTLILVSNDSPTQRTVGLRFQTADQGKSVWEKWFDRSITHFQYFDIKEEHVIPSPTRTDSSPVFVKPVNNPMGNVRQPNFQLTAYSDDSGAWIANADGLPLFQVCKTKGIKQIHFQSDNANGMRVYISDGCVVEEYHLTGLDNLFRFDAGTFE